MQKKPPTELMTVLVLVTVRRWQCSAAAEGRWGSLTKCGITKLVTFCRGSDSPSCRFVVKIREVIQYPDSKSWSVLERRPSTDRCAYDGPSYLPSRGIKRAAEEIAQVWDDGVHGSSSWPRRSVVSSVDPAAFWQISSKQSPCLIRFLFSINSPKNLVLRLDAG